ncbi:hypothetical protein GCM10023091_35280 [Ravibacter arvi]|uniref:NusG-like N-terminal domain-containing protein n=1 Tax=Ravibacter arvi TaxID=2051041 RepID=A0ABP8M554_9BACT
MGAMNWFVLYTKSRFEKKVAEGLRRKGLEVYCPVQRTRRKWSDRYTWVEEPLFRSYCFVRLTEKEHYKVFEVPGVVRYLFWLGKPAVVRDAEIEGLREILANFDHECVSICGFDVNDRVKVKGGVLDSLEGEIVEKRGSRLQVFIDALKVIVYVDERKAELEKV